LNYLPTLLIRRFEGGELITVTVGVGRGGAGGSFSIGVSELNGGQSNASLISLSMFSYLTNAFPLNLEIQIILLYL
jgi:hypothetical protein